MEDGNIPWHKPWKTGQQRPMNYVSKKPYSGINHFLLLLDDRIEPYYLTFKQVKDLGGSVKKGSKSQMVCFYKLWERDTGKDEPETIPVLRYYRVFNIEDTIGIEYQSSTEKTKQIDNFNIIKECEKIIDGYEGKPEIQHKHQEAFYIPSEDKVNMPDQKSFDNEQSYYATLFHELAHSTGHKDRLNRKELTDHNSFGSYDYGIEELVARMVPNFV